MVAYVTVACETWGAVEKKREDPVMAEIVSSPACPREAVAGGARGPAGRARA